MAAGNRVSQLVISAGASDSEDDLVNPPPPRKRTASVASVKGKTMPARRASNAATKPKVPAKSQSRQALKDRTNIRAGSDTEEVDNFDDDGAKPKAKRAKTTTTTTKTTRAPARGKAKRAPAEDLSVIPETQQDPNDVSQSIEMDPDQMVDVTAAPSPPRPQPYFQRARSTSVQPLLPRASARSVSAQPGYPHPRERSGSVSDTARERRGGDLENRRKLQDLTKRYESLNMKYQSLQEVGQNEAETNFEKLKRASDEKAKSANELIASLKKEIADLRKASAATSSSAAEDKTFHKQISTLTASNEALTTETTNLKSSLQVAQNEHKALEAKLIAARQQLSNSAAETEKPANSATTRADLNRSVGPLTGTEAQKEAKMKENLYSDLTGLIIRGVKRKDGEDEYDCIQTGRNGTLHFHLSIATSGTNVNPKTPSGLSYEDAEFAYEPLLDEARDRDLIDLLPDYLTEEICFPRNHAVKFYTRVVDSMTKRVVVEEE